MGIDQKQELMSQLVWHWENQLRARLGGLTDDEYFWEPAPECWTVRRIDGRWRPDGGLEPDPPPLTTIAWRLCHMATVLGARASYHFGDRSWSAKTVAWPGTAEQALGFLDRCWDEWISGVEALPAERLEVKSEGPPGTLDAQFAFGHVMLHVNREVIHHGAEVALLRDLWRATRPEDPFVTAALRADRTAVEKLLARDPGVVERVKAEHPALIVRGAERAGAEAVMLLADLGFDINAMTSRTALQWAAGRGDLELVRLLVARGADLEARDAVYRETALGWARYFNQTEVSEFLEALTT